MRTGKELQLREINFEFKSSLRTYWKREKWANLQTKNQQAYRLWKPKPKSRWENWGNSKT